MTEIPTSIRNRPRPTALFVNSLRAGGAERIMVTLANAMADRGHEIHMVMGRAHGDFLGLLSPAVRQIDLGTRSSIVGILRLLRYLKKARPGCLLSTNMICNCAAVIAKLVLGKSIRVVVREGSTWSLDRQYLGRNSHPAIRVASHFAPFLYPRSDAVIAVSRQAADDLMKAMKFGNRQVQVIYNPALMPDMEEMALESTDLISDHEDIPVILAVGRLSPAKDYQSLVRAFHTVRKRQPCRLLILGEGPERRRIENLVETLGLTHCVSMPGFIANPFPCMRKAAVYVLSSLYEGLPSALIQAMACGCPVVSTDCMSGPAEILDSGRWGILTETHNPEMLADSILKALNGKRIIVSKEWLGRFSVKQAVDKYLRVLGLGERAESAPPGK